MEKNALTLRGVLNQLEMDIGSLRTGLDNALSARTGERVAQRLEPVVEEAIRQLLTVRADLKSPVLILTLDSEHPCARCMVVQEKLSPDEHCHGCTYEAELQTYVPEEAKPYVEATECSAEKDVEGNFYLPDSMKLKQLKTSQKW